MNNTLLINFSYCLLFFILPSLNFAQVPRLGILSSFVVYTTAGAISGSGAVQLTGNVGNKDAGAITGLNAANVSGTIYNQVDSVTTQCAADLQITYDQLNALAGTVIHPAPVFGNGEILTAGVYDQGGAGSLNGNLLLDAQADTTAEFIFKIHGAFSTSAFSSISFLNGASPCNLFWLIEGALSLGNNSILKGSFIVNNGAISIAGGCNLEGRFISTTGAITFDALTGAISKNCVTNYWTGAAGTSDWFTNLNWTASVPNGIGTALIPAHIVNGNLYPEVIGGVVTVDNLTIESSATLLLNSATLQINGDLLNSGLLDASNATIEMKGKYPQTIPENAFTGNTVKNLLINNNLRLSGNINIIGKVNFGGNNDTLFTEDNLTLKSNINATAQIPDITNGGINSGNAIKGKVVIERFIPAKRAWRMLSVPISNLNSPSINSSWQEGVTAGNPVPGYGTQITGGTTVNGFDQVINDSASIKRFDNSTNSFVDIPQAMGTNIPISSYPAYFIFVRGDRNTNLADGENAALSATTLRIKGNIITDSFLVTVNPQNFTIAGNPFPATIDFHSLGKNNVSDKFYLWDPKLGGIANAGGYVTLLWDGSIYDITAAKSNVSQYIAGGAAFLVESFDNSNPGFLQFKEKDKTFNGTDNIFRPMANIEKMSINLSSVNADSSTDLLDGVITSFSNQSSNLIDRADALKIFNPSENISLQRNGSKLSIERRSTFLNTDTIFISLSSLNIKDYKLLFNTQGFLNTTVSAVLKDNYDTTTNNTAINMNGLTEVNFKATSVAASRDPNRFGIVLTLPTPVPVKFYHVNALAKQKDILVNFETATESGIRFYQVQSSADGVNFNTLAEISPSKNNGAGAAYSWIDINAGLTPGVHYYRIRSIEITDHSDFSIVVKVSIGRAESKLPIFIFNNAGNDHSIKMKFNNVARGNYNLVLYNSVGQLIKKISLQHNGNNNSNYIFNLNYKLIAGIYQLQLSGINGFFTTSIIRQ